MTEPTADHPGAAAPARAARQGTRRPAVLLGAAMAVIAAVLALWLRPAGGSIDGHSMVEGDTTLAAAALEHLPDGVYGAVVAEVTPQGTRTAAIGVPLEGTVEIGSVSKGLTGLLYADAIERGEIEPQTPLGELLDLGDSPAADITLEELSQHRSGLPRLAGGVGTFARSYASAVLGTNPYADDLAGLLADLRAADLGPREPSYSNLGFAALGHALAAAAGMDYPTLLHERLAVPADLTALSLPSSRDGLGPEAIQGRDQQGRRPQAWVNEAYAPTGTGIRADAATMAQLAELMLAGSVPGAQAMEPTADFHEGSIGAAWFTDTIDGAEVVWHNGGTGGFFTWFGLDLEHGTALFLSAATNQPVDQAGQALLAQAGGDR